MKTSVLGFLMLTGMGLGCSAMPKHELRHIDAAEVRGTAAVHPGRARALVSGPAVVRHFEADGAGKVTLYLADDPGIRDRVCPSAAAENATPIAVLDGSSQLTDLVVPKGQRVCAAVSGARAAEVAWHARATDATQDGSYNVALVAR
jgi:hypothetical protein